MKRLLPKIFLGVIFVVTLFLGIHFANNGIGTAAGFEPGISANRLEADIRKEQKIPDDWTVDGNVSGTMAAFISYPQDKSDYIFSVYVTRPGLSSGYFFRGDGNVSADDRYITKCTVQGHAVAAFISVNTQQVFQVEIGDGDNIRVVDIDCTKPFSIVLPLNEGTIRFYNLDGEVVEYRQQPI